MSIVKVDVYPEYWELYRTANYPLGKSRKGFKKWIKKRMIKALTDLVRNESYK